MRGVGANSPKETEAKKRQSMRGLSSPPPAEPEPSTLPNRSRPRSPSPSKSAPSTASWIAGVSLSAPSSSFLLLASLISYCIVLSISGASTKVVDEWGHALRTNPPAVSHDSMLYTSADLGRSLLPHIDAPWLPDLLIISLIILCVFAFIWPDPRGHHLAGDRRKRLALFLFAHGSILIMRTSTTVVTVHPVSSPFCTTLFPPQQPKSDVPLTVPEEEIGFLLNTGCYDMMFSGHVSFSVLAALFCIQAPNLPRGLKILSGLLALGSFVGNIAVGDHYSADVLVGSYLSFLVFMLFRKPLLKTYHHQYTPRPKRKTYTE